MKGGKLTYYIERRFEFCSSLRGLKYWKFSHGVANDQIFQEVSLNCLRIKKKEPSYFWNIGKYSLLDRAYCPWKLEPFHRIIKNVNLEFPYQYAAWNVGKKRTAHDAQIEEKTHDGRLIVESRKLCLKHNTGVMLSVQNHFMS